ncbi:cytochrome c oxidase assembly protein COX11, mitochondrial [Diaphorina citri]|uniref:Cytochrome c oxidase assembly protein COX11, mitochondrial n=1 Tax=Diaphorina citri TaxID=121845 RepID=A0A3Q0JEU6_DIACI|nr:cytochrome c oxidase assembly protein COX11, mitochondrial [Diaphorina citri]
MFNHLFKIIGPRTRTVVNLQIPRTPHCICSKFHSQPSQTIFKGSNLSDKCYNGDLFVRHFSKQSKRKNVGETSVLYYITAFGVLVVGCTYAAVPLYRMFCQATSYGGTVVHSDDPEKVAQMKKVASRPIKITFNADTSSSMRWNFRPQQADITDRGTINMNTTSSALHSLMMETSSSNSKLHGSTSAAAPMEDLAAGSALGAGEEEMDTGYGPDEPRYCRCNEKPNLSSFLQVDMPVFFYIDPEFVEDPRMEEVDNIILSYTFFESKEGFSLPIPSYALLNKH